MTERYINYDIELNANDKLMDVLKSVGEDDELIITMNRSDADQSGYIFHLLKDNGFEVLPKGGHDDNEYHIIARRKK